MTSFIDKITVKTIVNHFYSHLFSIKLCNMQDFPLPALPIMRNLKR